MSFKNLRKLTLVAILALGAIIVPFTKNNQTSANSSYNQYNGKFTWYSAFIDDPAGDVYTSNFDGTDPVNLNGDDGRNNTNPQWHPSGERIVFDSPTAPLAGDSSRHSIYIMDKDGSNVTLLVSELQSSLGNTLCPDADPSCPVFDASFSPDGTKIAFHLLSSDLTPAGARVVVGNYNYASNSVSGLQYLTDTDNAADTEPIWSSDGSKIIVSHTEDDGATYRLRVYKVSDGSILYTSSSTGWGSPQFGPQAGQDVVVAGKTGGEIYVINLTNCTTTCTASGDTTPFTTLSGFSGIPPATWSPNGKKIAVGRTLGAVSVIDYATKAVGTYQIAGYNQNVSEVDWTFATAEEVNLPNVSVECETEVGQACTTTIPEFCTNEIETAPLNGTSVVDVDAGTVTYTPTGNSSEEENYVHVREDVLGNTAKCFVKITFINDDETVVGIPKTGVVGGIIGVALAGAVAGGAMYYQEHKKKQGKKLSSEK